MWQLTPIVDTADSADAPGAARAIAKGLASTHTAEHPGYYVHLSGAGILTWYDIKHNRYGEPPLPEQSYNDVTDIDRILNLPDEAIHKDVESILQSIDSDAVKFLMVSPPVIYGVGRGLVHKQSFAITEIVRATVDLGYTPIIGAGKAKWDNVHVEDLAELLAKAVEASQAPSKKEDDTETWGKKGYYFVTTGEHQWDDLALWIAEEVHRQGYIPEPKTKSVSMEDMIQAGYKAAVAWGTNSKSEAERAKKYLGWESKAPSLKETIADAVAAETAALGLKPKYK
jgi:nucleoside-diphosphate-sugar epimerase